MKVSISAETTIDITKELSQKYDIKKIPLFIRLGDEELLDGEFPCSKIFEYVKKSKMLPKTSAPNEENYIQYFKELLKDYDVVIHFSISSDISSSYTHALAASKHFDNVYVIDSRSLSTGIALQCIKARKMAEKGVPPEEITRILIAKTNEVQASFVLQELNYLYKGGRCSSLAYFGSNLLKIKPQIIVENGKMKSHKKFMGSTDNSYLKYVNATLEEFNKPDLDTVFITYTTCKPKIIEQIKNKLMERGFKNIYITTAGATITSYCGEGCLGILYYNNK